MIRALTILLATTALAGAAVAKAPPKAPKAPPKVAATPLPPAENQALAHDILKELIEIDSTHARGSTVVAHAVAQRALAAGFAPADVVELAPADHPTKGNVIIRLRGKGKGKPIMWIGHLDVVEANPEDWTVPPFKLTEKDGYWYGRGTEDMKGDDAAVLASLIRMKKEGFVPDRDIIGAFTADEEAGADANGADWLFREHKDLVNAGLVLNPDAGGGAFRGDRRLFYGVQTSEKTFVTFTLETTNRGGHSSRPRPDNAIYQLARGLVNLDHYAFPVRLTPTTKAYFASLASMETGQRHDDLLDVSAHGPDAVAAAARLSAGDNDNAHLRTTCVATQIVAGHAEAALPQRARATVNCRMLPGDTEAETMKKIEAALGDPGIKVTVMTAADPGPESPLDPKFVGKLEGVVHSMWPGLMVMPTMDVGASDSIPPRKAGIPTYGVSSVFGDIDDSRAHGRDERIKATAFYEGVEFTYRLMRELSKADK